MGSLYNLFNEYIDSLGLYMQEKAEKELSKALIRKANEDEVCKIIATFDTVLFETGFILGQMFDVGDPEAEEYIRILVEEMRKKRAFPIFPRRHNNGKANP